MRIQNARLTINKLVAEAYQRFSELDPEELASGDIKLSKPLEITTPQGKRHLVIGNYSGYLAVHSEPVINSAGNQDPLYEIIVQASPEFQIQNASSELRETVIRSMIDAMKSALIYSSSQDHMEAREVIINRSPIRVVMEPGSALSGSTLIQEYHVLDLSALMVLTDNPFPRIRANELDDHILHLSAGSACLRKSA